MTLKLALLAQILICPNCHGDLIMVNGKLRCIKCGLLYGPNKYGYAEFILRENLYEVYPTTEQYAEDQKTEGVRVYHEWLKPLLFEEPFERVLEVGCGIGKAVSLLREEGFDAYGVDLPNLSKFWDRVGNDPRYYICADASQLPFPNNFFDVVFSLGVIEHIGTKIAAWELTEDYQEMRQSYANELLRVTKAEGRIIVDCPNKSFPIDISHGYTYHLNQKYMINNLINNLRTLIWNKIGINIHPIWGKYHLLSYGEVRQLFCDKGGARYLKPARLNGRFAIHILGRGYSTPLRWLAKGYLKNLPSFLRPTLLNPYMLVQIRK